jgi:two-component system sensor histidine kinase/response regulator
MTEGRLLIVDDEAAQLNALCDTLGQEGYATRGFESPLAALADLKPGDYDLLLTDLQMPDMDGIALIAAAHEIDPNIGAIVMTGNGAIDTAVRAMRNGALDYILKPFRLKEVLPVLVRARDLLRLRRENADLQARERERAEELAAAYQDLESFSYSISHDLRGPLLFVKDFAARLERDYGGVLDENGRHVLQLIGDGCRSMDEMVVGLLAFSRATRLPVNLSVIDMTQQVRAVIAEARAVYPNSRTVVDIGTLPPAAADQAVIRHVWANLIRNAFKYSAKRDQPHIRITGRTCSTSTSCSGCSSGCTAPRISRARAWDWPSRNVSSPVMAGASGREESRTPAPALNSRCRPGRATRMSGRLQPL